MNFYDIDLEEGDCGVIFKLDKTYIGFGTTDGGFEIEELYDADKPEVMVALTAALMDDDPIAELCRKMLADLLVSRTQFGPKGVTH